MSQSSLAGHRIDHHDIARVALAAAMLALASGAATADDPTAPAAEFAVPETLSTNEGHATLEWQAGGTVDDGVAFELQRSRRPDFGNHTVHYRGPQRALFVSGLKDGATYFRVRAVLEDGAPGAWSDTVTVVVDYPATGRVVTLLGVGLLVFLATVGAIVAGWRRTSGKRGAEAG